MAFGSINVPGATKQELNALQTALNGKSNTNHTHDDRYYTESEIDTKLNGKSDTSHTHKSGDITSGTLPVERGGTGQATLQATRKAMGLGNTTGALPVENGGTGATTAINALKNLGGASAVRGNNNSIDLSQYNMAIIVARCFSTVANYAVWIYTRISTGYPYFAEIISKNLTGTTSEYTITFTSYLGSTVYVYAIGIPV